MRCPEKFDNYLFLLLSIVVLLLLFTVAERLVFLAVWKTSTGPTLTLFIQSSVVAHHWDSRHIPPNAFTSRSCCTNRRRRMTCRPIIPTSASPITTTYRKHLLAAFAQAHHLPKRDNDTTELMKALESSTATSGFEHIERDEEYKFLKQVSTLSTQRTCNVSAMAQCCTIQQIFALRDNYNEAANQLHTILSNPNLDGNTKHQMHCQHRYNYGRQPFVCKDCWSYLPICICHKQQQGDTLVTDDDNSNTNGNGDSIFQRVPILPLPPMQHLFLTARVNDFDMIDIIMWTHHKEWGSPSNTGSVLVVALQQLCNRNDSHPLSSSNIHAYMLMKGYNEHDDQFEQLLRPRNDAEIVIPVVLWAPAAEGNTSNTQITSLTTAADEYGDEIEICKDECKNKSRQESATSTTMKRQFVSVDELLEDLQKIRTKFQDSDEEGDNLKISVKAQQHMTIRLVMIAVEGTWNQAKRMVTKLPHQVRALHLSDMELFQWRTLLPFSLYSQTSKNEYENNTKKLQIPKNTREQVQIHGAVSILDPLRKQKTLNRYASKKEKESESTATVNNSSNDDEPTGTSKVINTNKVCTVEAAVSALVALSAIPIPDGDYIINLADQKVIRTVTFQGKMTLRNIISHW
jgi:hypothetical protein